MSGFDLYSPIAIRAAQTYGVPVPLFLWQIGQESSWQPNITSDGLHVGLGQFDVATAQQYGVNRNDPTSSLFGAAKYDAALFNQYGDWQTALTHYGTIGPNAPDSVNQAFSNVAQQLGLQTAGASTGGTGGTGGCASYWVKPFNLWGFSFPGVCAGLLSAEGLPGAKKGDTVGDYIPQIKAAIDSYIPQVSIIVVALIFIAAGLFLFKGPAQVVIAKAKDAVA